MKKIIIITIIFSLLAPNITYAAYIQFTGGETGSVNENTAQSGVVSVQTTTKYSGSYGYRMNPTGTSIGRISVRARGTNGSITTNVDSDLAIENMYTSLWVKVDTCPAGGAEEFMTAIDTGGNNKFRLYINYNCTLTILNGAGTKLATTTGVLSSTWKNLQVRIDSGTSAMGSMAIKTVAISAGKISKMAAKSIKYCYLIIQIK